jgi:hypothetical protein
MDIRMSQNLILLPVLAQVALTLVVLTLMGPARAASMRERRQRLDDMALAGDKDWGAEALKRSNNFKNQFEVPVLFYAVTAFALITRMVDPLMLTLATLFVASRIVHTLIHIGPNRVAPRAIAFLVGLVLIVAMWVILAWRVAAAGW